jgi:hypothetical protein
MMTAHELGVTGTARHSRVFWRRLVASVIDLTLCVYLPLMFFGMPPRFVPDHLLAYWIQSMVAIVLGYVTLFSALGATPGMLITGVRIRRVSSGRRPGIARGLGRGIIALIGIASLFALMVFGLSDPPMGGYTAPELTILFIALAIFAVSILGRLWMLIDHTHRTLFDRLLGLSVVPSSTTEPASSKTTNAMGNSRAT